MLALTRSPVTDHDTIHIHVPGYKNPIVIRLVTSANYKARIGIEADPSMIILRAELEPGGAKDPTRGDRR